MIPGLRRPDRIVAEQIIHAVLGKLGEHRIGCQCLRRGAVMTRQS